LLTAYASEHTEIQPMNLFAYGTLMWPEVLEAVIGKHLDGVPAVLHGYVRLRVKGEHYPAVVPSGSRSVEGLLFKDLSDTDFEHLDRFEGEEYERTAVSLNGIEVQVYVLSDASRDIADCVPWRPEDMKAHHLTAFCREYKGWQTERPLPQVPYRLPESGASASG
jgi:gamma-glutamylcyclotransferase (GGCT)/AIG2-like uncharacterized protein YtfP